MRVNREDWHTARIVSILANVHSKHKRHKPIDFMYDREFLKRERPEKSREPMIGEEILERFRQLGVPIIDQRKAAIE